ncbi:MAG TPA: hypothetical protein VFA03_09905 [Acetobacteraceae bacterium]|nr:hypothetical protein [Acetobacteraceae bacterium]
MSEPPAVIVHGLADAERALAPGRPVTLLSAPGAALYLGVAAWRAIVTRARAAHPAVPAPDILDCADATGYAFSALRLGLHDLVLWPPAPGRAACAAAAAALGARLREAPPPALDLADRKAARTLAAWLGGADDSPLGLG